MLAKQEDVGAASRKLDHHASSRIDDQSPTFPFFFPFELSSRSRIILLRKNLCVFQEIDFIAHFWIQLSSANA